MLNDSECKLCGYDRRGGSSNSCPECGFEADPRLCLLARNPNEPREVGIQLMLLLITLGIGVVTYLTFRHVLLVPAPFVTYAVIVSSLLIAAIGIFRFHHRRRGWTLLLQIEPDGLRFWSRRLLACRYAVPWTNVRHIEVSRVKGDVYQLRLRYELPFWTMLAPPQMIFVAADNARAMLFAAVIAEQAASAVTPGVEQA